VEIDFFEEPELEFGVSCHVDMRFGLMNFGPVDFDSPLAPKEIKVGIVGTSESVEGIQRWLEHCRGEIPAKQSKQPNLFPKFPGFRMDAAFQSTLVMDSSQQKEISLSSFEVLKKESGPDKVVGTAVNLFYEELKHISDKRKPDVFICAVPQELLDITRPEIDEDEESESRSTGRDGKDFHDFLKARAMHLEVPIQLVLPSTYDESKRRKQKRNPSTIRTLQDEATRAWNFHTAIYYKAQGVPWRLVRDPSEYTTCYVGVSFFRTLGGSALLTSVAQVFNERGEGVIVRGGQAKFSKDDRQVHLERSDAEALLTNALATYKKEHMNFPARVVVHKSSTYTQDEEDGFLDATRSAGIEMVDLLSVDKTSTRLFRIGSYPPLRGTFLSLDNHTHILYTKGGVDFFSTYPGMYVPRPLIFKCEHTEQTPRYLAREILALTKMNWNNTQFDGGMPIAMRAAKEVGSILKYVEKNGVVASSYRFYM
jgi:hypothetical protein